MPASSDGADAPAEFVAAWRLMLMGVESVLPWKLVVNSGPTLGVLAFLTRRLVR